jgi:two-component system nitrate/nitrite response regulator NarL
VTDTLRVVIGHPWLLARQALRIALEDSGADVVADAAAAPQLVAASSRLRPDVVLVAHGLVHDAAQDLADRVRTQYGSRLLVLGSTPAQAELLEALESGADGFLSPLQPLAALADAAARVGAGETYIPAGMLSGLLRELITRRRDDDAVLQRYGRLSRREREVLRLIAEGATAPEMATALFVSPHTVRTHVQNVIEKLGVHSRVEAASIVLEYDLLSRFPDDQR